MSDSGPTVVPGMSINLFLAALRNYQGEQQVTGRPANYGRLVTKDPQEVELRVQHTTRALGRRDFDVDGGHDDHFVPSRVPAN